MSKKTTKSQLDDYISQAEAARMRGVSIQAITNLIQRGKLTGYNVAGRIVLLRSEVENFVPQPKLGRPPKKSVPVKTVPVKTAKKKALRKTAAPSSERA